jgi:invasion protein IalB
LDCQVEQRVVISTTGQLLIDMTVRLPTGTTAPVMFIHTPFGLFLPAGLQLTVDGAQLASLPLQTCDGAGCYAGSSVTPQLLNAMRHGTTLTVTFQNLQKKNIDVPVSLLGFGQAYSRIQ